MIFHWHGVGRRYLIPGILDRLSTSEMALYLTVKFILVIFPSSDPGGHLSEDNPYNVSFTWNTDGIPVFKSSKFSLWPFYLVINELP
jgi:hypothetical protein